MFLQHITHGFTSDLFKSLSLLGFKLNDRRLKVKFEGLSPLLLLPDVFKLVSALD